MVHCQFKFKGGTLRRAISTFASVSSLLFLCSCATPKQTSAILSPSQLPAEITLSSDAGHGGELIVTLRLESGEELPVLLDTGAPFTLLDKSFESKLGKRRGTMPMTLASQPTQQGGVYDSLGLYLGNTPLVTGSIVGTYDFKQPLKGILGMDCLKHYCIQLDFQSRQLRFLNSNQLNAAELGQKFPLTFENNCPLIDQRNLIGESAKLLLVDTGCNIDGLVDRATNNFGGAYLLRCNWAGQTYTNLIVAAVERFNAIGFGFLARHIVTFDFPGKTMYLKQTVV